MFKDIFNDKAFNRKVIALVVPMIIQNTVSNFVNLLDNIMIGSIGTFEMSGASIANMLIFVFNLGIFGSLSGVGIFTTQYYGSKDDEGIRSTFRLKHFVALGLFIIAMLIFAGWAPQLIGLYLTGEGSPEDAAATLGFGMDYLKVMYFGLLPFGLTQAYASTLRETGESRVPMIAGIIAICVNLFFNYVLIFGHFGAPRLGVTGAAIATVMSRFVELAVIVIWTFRHSDRFTYMKGLYSTMKVPASLLRRVAIKGTPLMFNEILWSIGANAVNQSYSIRSLDVVAALNINSTLWNCMSCIFMSLGGAAGIVVGAELGAGRFDGAKLAAKRMSIFTILSSFITTALMLICSVFFPEMYNTTDSVRELARYFITVAALTVPINSISHVFYFILRSGGKTFITFLFDSTFTWLIQLPIVWFLSHKTGISIYWLFVAGHLTELAKVFVGYPMVKKGIWINNIIGAE